MKITGLGKDPEQCCFRRLWKSLKKTELVRAIWCHSAAEAAPLPAGRNLAQLLGSALSLCSATATVRSGTLKQKRTPICSAQLSTGSIQINIHHVGSAPGEFPPSLPRGRDLISSFSPSPAACTALAGANRHCWTCLSHLRNSVLLLPSGQTLRSVGRSLNCKGITLDSLEVCRGPPLLYKEQYTIHHQGLSPWQAAKAHGKQCQMQYALGLNKHEKFSFLVVWRDPSGGSGTSGQRAEQAPEKVMRWWPLHCSLKELL